MQKGEHGKDGSRHRPGGMWIACDLPKPVPRSTKTTIMTVHVNPIMQAAPSQRRIISIIEASNQLLFHSQKLFFVEWIWWRINISLKSCSQSKKLQPGGKPNSFAFRNPGWQCGCIHPQLSWYLSSALIVPVGLFGWWDAAHRFLHVYIINFTTGLQAYIHTFMIIFPNAVPHSLLSIIFNTACFHVT